MDEPLVYSFIKLPLREEGYTNNFYQGRQRTIIWSIKYVTKHTIFCGVQKLKLSKVVQKFFQWILLQMEERIPTLIPKRKMNKTAGNHRPILRLHTLVKMLFWKQLIFFQNNFIIIFLKFSTFKNMIQWKTHFEQFFSGFPKKLFSAIEPELFGFRRKFFEGLLKLHCTSP